MFRGEREREREREREKKREREKERERERKVVTLKLNPSYISMLTVPYTPAITMTAPQEAC